MKKYRRFIRASKYLNEDSDDVLFDDSIEITIDIDLPGEILSSIQNSRRDFPGKEQFRKDVIDILENEYKFEVIEDVYDGIKQKGHFSNHNGSLSLYVDTYYDPSNAKDVIDRLGISNLGLENEKIYCFIHFRFSDHPIIDSGDILHQNYVKKNEKKFTRNRPDIVHSYPDEKIEISEYDLKYCYDEAIDDLKYFIDTRIGFWVRKGARYLRRKNS